MNTVDSNSTLEQSREWLRKHLNDGARCPCCSQFAKIYRRKINAGMARSLIEMWQVAGCDWVHLPTAIGARSREEGKLAYWALVEESTEPRDDGGRAGWWRVTPKGRAFVAGLTRVPKYAHIYDGRCLGFDDTELVGIRDCLGSRFNYDDLMGGI